MVRFVFLLPQYVYGWSLHFPLFQKRSSNGKIDGEWSHDAEPIYTLSTHGKYDGGHPMLFTSTAGHTYMAIHSPNSDTNERKARPTFIPFYEKDGVITLDLTVKPR